MPLDLGKTPRSLTPLIAKAVSVHGGLRLAPPSQSRYSVYFSPLGGGQVKVEISKGHSGIPKKLSKLLWSKGSIDAAVLKGCDGMVQAILGIPGSFR